MKKYYKFFLKLSKINNSIIFIFLFFVFCFRGILLGNNRMEEYPLGIFSTKILYKKFENLFLSFYDLYGPGTGFPLGNALNLHPLGVIIDNYFLFLLIFVFLCLYIQCNYLKKILKLYKIKVNQNFLNTIVIFSYPNLILIFLTDYLGAFHTYSIFFMLFYYYKKFFSNLNYLNLTKLYLVYSFWILNGAIQLALFFSFFLIIEFFFNIKKYKTSLFKIQFWVLITLVFTVTYLQTYNLFEEYVLFKDTERLNFGPFLFNEILGGLFYPIYQNFHEIKHLPFFSFIIPVSLIFVLSQSFRLNLDTPKIIFLILIFLSFTDLSKIFPFISSMRSFLFCFTFLSYLIFFEFLSKQKMKIQFSIMIIFIVQMLFVYKELSNHMGTRGNNHYMNLYSKTESNIKNVFDSMSKDMNVNINRVYFTSNLFKKIYYGRYSQWGLYSISDLNNYNLIPFNGKFKNFYLGDFEQQRNKMHGQITPDFDFINNKKLMKVFRIKYLLSDNGEVSKIGNKDYKYFDRVFFEKYKDRKKPDDIMVFKNELEYYYVDKKFLKSKDFNRFKSCKQKLSYCFSLIEQYFKSSADILINRVGTNQYIIQNKSDYSKLVIFPFRWSKNWLVDNKKNSTINVKNVLTIVDVQAGNQVNVSFKDEFNKLYRAVIYLLICTLLIIVVLVKIYAKKN